MSSDNYMKINDIPGESTAPGHENSIEILSFTLGTSMSTIDRSTAGSPTHGAPHGQDVIISKLVDSASPLLYAACCTGKNLKDVIISVNRTDGAGGQVEYFQIKMTDTIVSSIQQGGSSGGGVPMDTVSLNYATIELTYTKTSSADPGGQGNVQGGWNYVTNQPAPA
jgi:type VI secretion system secreted protein Hcp